jgi:hypothetical protein
MTRLEVASGRLGGDDVFVVRNPSGHGSDVTLPRFRRFADVRPGGDSQPSWSPDGQKIARRSSPVGPVEIGDIWVMNADGTEPVQLTDDPLATGRPRDPHSRARRSTGSCSTESAVEILAAAAAATT